MRSFRNNYKYILLFLVILIGIFGLLISNNLKLYTQKIKEQKSQSSISAFIQKIVPKPVPTPPPVSIRLLFAGDLMMDRYIRSIGAIHGYDYIFSELGPFLKNWDHVIANFESPVTDFPSVSQNSAAGSRANFIFTTHPDALKSLVANNLSIVSIGNNHINNFGESGYQSTLRYLAEATIDYFGDTTYSTEPLYLLKNIRGVSVAFVSFNQFIPDGYEKSLRAISSVKNTQPDLIIMLAHWDNEYRTIPSKITVERAHAFIDEGVDLIIGSHPHVIQNIEEYNGKKIYYSLGNFVFDQYFSPETMKGMLVGVTYNAENKSMDFEEFFTLTQTSGKTTLITQ